MAATGRLLYSMHMTMLVVEASANVSITRLTSTAVDNGEAIIEAIGRKPKGHDFIISRRAPSAAVARHMNVTGG